MSLPVPAKIALRYMRSVLLGLDMFGNTLTGGVPGETISYRAAKLRDKGVLYGCIMCKFLDIFQKDHCTITEQADDKTASILPGH